MREKRVKHERIIYKNKQTALVELKRQADEEHASDEEGATVEMAEQADDDEVKRRVKLGPESNCHRQHIDLPDEARQVINPPELEMSDNQRA